MTVKERLHHLVDDLPENEAHAALRFIEFLRDASVGPCPECGQMEHTPNAETRRVMAETDAGIGLTTHSSVDEMFRKLGL